MGREVWTYFLSPDRQNLLSPKVVILPHRQSLCHPLAPNASITSPSFSFPQLRKAFTSTKCVFVWVLTFPSQVLAGHLSSRLRRAALPSSISTTLLPISLPSNASTLWSSTAEPFCELFETARRRKESCASLIGCSGALTIHVFGTTFLQRTSSPRKWFILDLVLVSLCIS